MMRTFLLVALLSLTSVVRGQDQETQIGNPITRAQVLALDRPRPAVTKKIVPAFPAIAAAKQISGTVLIDVDVDPNGNVIEARVVMSDRYIRDSARKAALGWKFNISDGTAIRSIRLTFIFHDESYVPPEKEPQFTSPYQVEIRRIAVP